MIMRPKQFYIVSLLMLGIALSLPLQIMFLYGHHWSETSAIFSKMTWLNWLVCFSLLGASYLYFSASRLLLFATPVVLALVAFNNYVVGHFAQDFSLLQTTLATAAVGVLFTPLLLPSSQVVMKDPKRRWWRRSKRFNKRVSATINPYVGDMIQSYTYDVSKTGAFVCLSDETAELPRIGDTIRLSFNVTSMRKIRCEAVVVRVSEATGRYPKGVGLKIIDIEKNHQKSFQSFVQSNDYTQ